MDFEQADNLPFLTAARQRQSNSVIDGAFDMRQNAFQAEAHDLNACSPFRAAPDRRLARIAI
jgi:hypothetical protein